MRLTDEQIEELAKGMFYAGMSKSVRMGVLGETTWENVTDWERIRHRRMARFARAAAMRDAAGVAREKAADEMSSSRDVDVVMQEAARSDMAGEIAEHLETIAKGANDE